MRGKVLALFDVDGTLTKPRNNIEPDMIQTIEKLMKTCSVAVVGGSDYAKIEGQLTPYVTNLVDFVFSENGLYSKKQGKLFHQQSIKDYLTEPVLQDVINYTLYELSQIRIPVKRGTFIEYRTGMLNISPIGRNCSQEERDQYEIYDKEHFIRRDLINKLSTKFANLNLKYSIGGQISFDLFPQGWDKTYCLRFLEEFEEIYFFGDKTFEGGNDYEIFSHPRTKGFSVTSPADTIQKLNELFF
ncbi:hypothetical protein pb186bvf_010997 [Paramecium bursaria]